MLAYLKIYFAGVTNPLYFDPSEKDKVSIEPSDDDKAHIYEN